MSASREYHIDFKVGWRFKDIIFVTFTIYFFLFFAYPLLDFLLKDEKTIMHSMLYIAALLNLFVPILWVKRRYRLNKEALGIKKGNWSFIRTIIIGAGVGLGCFFVSSIIWGPQLKMNRFLIDNFLRILLLPLSIAGFEKTVLGPLGEEVFDRGFLYGYLRGRLGVSLGLLVQATIFSLLHIGYAFGGPVSLFFERLLIGLILGILYEASNSLYPSIICHGMINLLYSIAMIQK
jgi:membrane protease YdiL (CAAX protease family)